MKKRWGVRIVAILMLIAGLLLFLLGILPAIRVAIQGAGTGMGAWLAIPSALFGCAGALFLLVAGSVLLTVGKIAENFAAAVQPMPVREAAQAPVVPLPPSVAITEERARPAVAVAALPAATTAPAAEAVTAPEAAVAALSVAAVVPVAEAVATPEAGSTIVEPAAAGALAVALATEEQTAAAEAAPADEIIEETQAAAPIETAGLEEIEAPAEPGFRVFEVAKEEFAAPHSTAPAPGVAESPMVGRPSSPQDEVSALQAQLMALQAPLHQLEGVAPGSEGLPAAVEDEGPAPGATGEVKLPGAEDAARVAAEMAALNLEPKAEAS
jgi:hypothetical protein